MEPSERDHVYRAFPRLRSSPWELTSPVTPDYNCVAWAAEDATRWWWPAESYFWPSAAPREASLDGFVTAFVSMGFELAEGEDAENLGYEVIAIFANEFGPTHVARRLSNDSWTSKLGQSYDITHELSALEGAVYGSVRQLMRRPEHPEDLPTR